MVKSSSILLALLLVVAGVRGDESLPSRRPASGWRDFRIGLEQFGAGCCCGNCIGGVSYCIYFLAMMTYFDESGPIPQDAIDAQKFALGLACLAPLGSASSAYVVGNRFYKGGEQGSLAWTLVGAYAGLLTAVGIGVGGHLLFHDEQNDWEPGWFYPAAVLPGAGAALGYQLSRSHGHEESRRPGQLDLPALCLKPARNRQGRVEVGFDARLIRARF